MPNHRKDHRKDPLRKKRMRREQSGEKKRVPPPFVAGRPSAEDGYRYDSGFHPDQLKEPLILPSTRRNISVSGRDIGGRFTR